MFNNYNKNNLFIFRLADSKANEDADITWSDVAQSWPQSSVRSHQWLRAKWKRLKSTVDGHQNLNLKGSFIILFRY